MEKISYFHRFFIYYNRTQFFRAMKIGLILSFVIMGTICASAFSQNRDITLNATNVTLKEVIKQIERQSDYTFFYNEDYVDLSKLVSLSVNKKDIGVVLSSLCSQANLNCKFMENNLVAITSESQQKQLKITGKVTDNTGQPLVGVTVGASGSSRAVITDINGTYSFTVNLTDKVLVFSFVGMKKQEVVIGSRTTINVVLENETSTLDEVVVVGYGSQKKLSMVSAVSTIKSADITRRAVSNTVQSLQGLSPGLTILDQGGAPGASNITTRVRGITTLSGNNPLILVDGLEQSISNLNPDDIESLSVLKDAAATAIYGSKAATGVILITTKRGKEEPISVTYNGYVGMQQLGNHPQSISTIDYLKQQNIAYVNAGQAAPYSTDLINAYSTSSDRIKYPLANDWYNALYHSAIQYKNNFSISGGTDKFKGLVNVSDFHQDGVLNHFSNNVREIRINTDFTPSSKFKFSFDANYRKIYSTQPQNAYNVYYNTLHGAQLTVPRYPDGGYGISAQGNSPIVCDELSGFNNDYFDNLSANIRGDWNIVKNLKFSVQYGITSTFDQNKIFTNAYSVVDETYSSRTKSVSVNSLNEARTNTYLETINNLLTYNIKLGNHTVNLLGGYSQIYNSATNLTGFRNAFFNNSIQALSSGAASSRDNGGSDYTSGLRSYFGRLNYDFGGKYILELNGRYDGSSNFTGKNLYSFFPSFSAGWRISQEKFWKSLSGIIPELKLRGSYGSTGNQTVSRYSFYDALSSNNYDFNGGAATGYALLNYANKDIQWETTKQTDIGLDASFLQNRLNLTFDYYDKTTSGILLSLPISGAVGLNPPVQNAGVVSNKGWEVALSYRGQVNKFQYDIAFNMSNNINKVLDLKGTGPYISGSTNDGLYVTQVGLPIGAIWGFKTNGFYKDQADVTNSPKYDPNTYPGDIKYVDINNDKKITASDRAMIGDPFPHYSYGLSTNFRYANFDLSIFFQGVMQQDARVSGAFADAGNNQGFLINIENDYWTPTNTDARFPRPQKFTDKNAQINDFWVIHMGYLRVKNLQLGYTLPKTLTDKLKIKKVRFYVSGTNLLTISKANEWGIDAEFPTGRADYYPQTKVFSLGSSINF